MSRWALPAAAAFALFLAVPASASHHPPNSVPGRVSMTVARTDPGTLRFQYTVTPPDCPNTGTGCYANYGKPYSILIYVDGPGGTTNGAVGLPSLVNAPSSCHAATQPVVLCDTNKRDINDPSTMQPISGSITVTGKWRKDATAEIVAEGFSLNTYKEGVPVPAPDCGNARAGFAFAFQKLAEADGLYRRELHDLAQIENAALIRLRIGELYEHLRNRAIEHFHEAQKGLANAQSAAAKARKELDDCEGVRKTRTAGGRTQCSETDWMPLLARGKKLGLQRVGPLIRRIVIEQKHKQKRRVASDVKRLRPRLKAEVKALKAFARAVDACR
jgi:hypothetical protein